MNCAIRSFPPCQSENPHPLLANFLREYQISATHPLAVIYLLQDVSTLFRRLQELPLLPDQLQQGLHLQRQGDLDQVEDQGFSCSYDGVSRWKALSKFCYLHDVSANERDADHEQP